MLPALRPAPSLAAALITLCLAVSASATGWFDGKRYPIVTGPEFPADDFVMDQARFWFEIYYHVAEDEGLLHDPFQPSLVLRKVKVPPAGSRAGLKAIDAELDALRRELRAAAAKDAASRSPAERELMARLPSHWDTTHVQLCAERLRFQRGLRNKFRAGVERSYRYLPLIDSTFAARGLPDRLKYLPHVESSFYPHAYSKVGAAGMWQFMKSSARMHRLKVGYHVDERRDPHASTGAAAAMLAYNHSVLKSWPLALVAYNHGPGGMARAVRETGTRDLTTIIKSYYSNTFGFASKNFYAEFLAASSIAMQADSLYPDLVRMEPLRFQRLSLPKAMGTRLLCSVTGLSAAELEEYNLALRPAIFRGKAQLPKGHVLNVPAGVDLAALAVRLGAGGPAVAALKPSPRGEAPGAATAKSAPADSASQALALADPAPQPAPVDKVETAVPATPAEAAPEAAPPSSAPSAVAGAPAPDLEALRRRARKAPSAPPAPTAPRMAKAAEMRPAGPASEPAPKGAVPAARGRAPSLPMPLATAPAAPARTEAPSLAAALIPPSPKAAAPSAVRPEPAVVDSNFALQASGLDKLAHPMDRFNPAVYNLDHEYVKGDLVIRVGTEETLSHYAEWAWIPERTLKKVNRIRSGRDLRMGRAVRIPIPADKAPEFLKRREEHYRGMEEDFYSNYYVSAVERMVVAKGTNLWGLVNEKEIPFWLLQKHNPGRVLSEVRAGDTLSLPLIETGIRKWGFTRYGNSREYLAGITRYITAAGAE